MVDGDCGPSICQTSFPELQPGPYGTGTKQEVQRGTGWKHSHPNTVVPVPQNVLRQERWKCWFLCPPYYRSIMWPLVRAVIVVPSKKLSWYGPTGMAGRLVDSSDAPKTKSTCRTSRPPDGNISFRFPNDRKIFEDLWYSIDHPPCGLWVKENQKHSPG
jgi:hypothetical protein